MAKKLTDSEIRWILSLDAKGVQGELKTLSSQTKELEEDNIRLEKELVAVKKQMQEAQKEMDKLTKAGKEDSKAFDEARKTYESAASDLDDYNKKIISNTNAIEKNEAKANALVKTLKLEDMTMGQLKNRAKDLERQLANTSKSTHPEAYNALEKELNAVKERMGELKNGSDSAFTVFKGGLMVLAGNLMTKAIDGIKQLVSKGVEWVKTGIDIAAKTEGIRRAFDKLNSPDLLSVLRKETKGLINDMVLMQSAVRADRFGIPINNLAKYLKFAQQRAQETGQSVDYLVESIVNGIGRKSPLILDNLGISAARLKQEMAGGADIVQATTKIVEEELTKQGDLALTSADKQQQANVKWENAQLKVGNRLKWLSDLWSEVSGNIADAASSMAGDTRSASEKFDDQAKKVANLTVNIAPLIDKYEEMSKTVKLSKNQAEELDGEHKVMLDLVGQITSAMPHLRTEFDQYGRAIGFSTNEAREFINMQKDILPYLYKDQLVEAKKNVQTYTKSLDDLNKKIEQGGEYKNYGGRGTWSIFTDAEKAQNNKDLAEFEKLLGQAKNAVEFFSGTTAEKQAEMYANREKRTNDFRTMNKQQLKAWIEDEKNAKDEYLNIAKQIYSQQFGGNYEVPDDKAAKKAIEKQKKELNLLLEGLETVHQQKMSDIRQRYLGGRIKSESKYKNEQFAREQAYLLLREQALETFLKNVTDKELKSDINKQIAELQNKRLDREVKFRADLEKIILDANPEAKEKQEYENRLRDLGLFGKSREHLQLEMIAAETDQEKLLIQKRIEALELLEKQHQDNMVKIRKDAQNQRKAQGEEDFDNSFGEEKKNLQSELDKREQEVQYQTGIGLLTGNDAFMAEVEVHNMRIEMIRKEIEAREAAGLETDKLNKELARKERDLTKTYVNEFNSRKQEYTKYGNDIGTVVGNVISGQQDALEGFSDVLLDILFDTLTQIINAEITKVVATATGAIARTTAEQVASKGFLGIGTAAILTGVITGAMTVAKTALKGLIKKKDSSSSDSTSSTTTYSRVPTSATRGFADGGYHEGYTGAGDKYEVKGFFPDGQPYHAGEYIIPREVLRLPAIAPYIRQIESARLNYSTRNTLPEGFADGGYHADTESPGTDNTLLKQSIDNMNELLGYLKANGVSLNYWMLQDTDKEMNDIQDFGKKG